MFIRGTKSPRRHKRRTSTGVQGLEHTNKQNESQITGVVMSNSAFEEAVKRSGVSVNKIKTVGKINKKNMYGKRRSRNMNDALNKSDIIILPRAQTKKRGCGMGLYNAIQQAIKVSGLTEQDIKKILDGK